MKLGTKMLSIATAGVLLTTSLAGCANGGQTPSPSVALPEGVPADVVQETLGFPRDTVVMTVDGSDITAEDILYFVTYSADQVNQASQYYGGGIDWAQDVDGVPAKDFVLNNAVETAKLYQVARNHAAELDCTVSEKDLADYQSTIEQMKTSLASQSTSGDGEAEYQRYMAYSGISPAGFDKLNQTPLLFNTMKEKLFGKEGSEALTDADVEQWITDNGVVRAKHILVLAEPTQDAEGNVTDDGMAAALEKANSIRAELLAAGDTEEKFDELMVTYTGDVDQTGAPNNPDGYTYNASGTVLGTQNSLVSEFTGAGAALELNAIGEPVQSTYGYHILMRLAPVTDDIYDTCITEKMNARTEEWVEAAKVETTDDYAKLDAEAYYTALTALRDEMVAAANPSPEPTATPEGTAEPSPSTTPAPSASPAA